MLTLYAVPASLYCAKVRIVLRHKGLAWNEVPPTGGYGSDAYRRIVPSGNLPALNHDGLLIGDSEAIAEYLDDRYPAPPMLPDTPAGRAKARELSRFHDTRLEPEVRVLFAQIDPEVRDRMIVRDQSHRIAARLSQLARLLGDHRADERWPLMLGDCGFPATATWIDALDTALDLGIDWPDTVRAYRQRLHGIAAVEAELETYRPTVRDWLAAKTTP